MKILPPFLSVLIAVLSYGCESRYSANLDPANVILISIDALRADHMGCYGYSRETSPVLDSLAVAGTMFANCQSQAPWTLPSHASLFTGLSVVSHGTGMSFGRLTELDGSLPSLPVELSSAGYNTMGIVNVSFLSPNFGFDRGFRFYDYNQRSSRNAAHTVKIANRALDSASESGEPFFLFVHLWDVHAPYTPTRPYDTMFMDSTLSAVDPIVTADGFWPLSRDGYSEPEYREHLLARYDGGIAYTDRQLSGLFGHVRELGISDNTLIIVMSDHGEEFLEHGGVDHGLTLFQEQLHVPLIFSGPGVPPRVISQPVGLYDVLPSILSYIGVETPAGVEGQDIITVAAAPDRMIPSSGIQNMQAMPMSQMVSLLRNDEKIICDMYTGEVITFNLASDPGERHTLDHADSQLVEAASFCWSTPPRAEPQVVDNPHELTRLRSLGYIN